MKYLTMIPLFLFVLNSPIENTAWKIIDASVTFNNEPVDSYEISLIKTDAKQKIHGVVLKIEVDSLFLIKNGEILEKARIVKVDDKKIMFEQQGKTTSYTYNLAKDGKSCTFSLPNGNFLKGVKL